jgi:alpha-tubulin suppressor-like RCC1 family protein
VVAVTAGYWHTCALMASGTLSCFGRNEFGQHGDGSTVDRSTPATTTVCP